MSAEEHKPLAMEVDSEGVMASHQDPHANAKLPALDEERVSHVPLNLDVRLFSLGLASGHDKYVPGSKLKINLCERNCGV